jgi:hypothetical protein
VVVWWRWIVDIRAPYLGGVTQDFIETDTPLVFP